MSQAPDVSMPHAGDILGGRYVLLERIGAGGMGRVFRARDEVLRRDVAIKIFATDGADEADPLRRMSEARTLAALDHPSLVTLFDARLDADAHVYLVMELIDGPSLQRRIERGPLTSADVAGIVEDLAGALAAVHDAGIVHRDVKPSNVLLRPVRSTERGFEAVLADFGVAHLIDATRLTTPGTVIGTAAYLAPEQVRGEPPQPTSDIYALGLLAIESLTRLHPFGGGSVQETLLARLARQPDVPADLAAGWRSLLADMTAQDPADRPAAEIVARRAAGLGAGSDVSSRAEALSETAPWAALGFTGAMDATQAFEPGDAADDTLAAALVAPAGPDPATAVGPNDESAPRRAGAPEAARADAPPRRRARSRPTSARRRWLWVGTAALAAVVASAHVVAFSLGSAGGVPVTGGVPASVPSVQQTTPAPAATDAASSSEGGAPVVEPVVNSGDDTVSSPVGASDQTEAGATPADGTGGASTGAEGGSVDSNATTPTTADGGSIPAPVNGPGASGGATGPGSSAGRGSSIIPGGEAGAANGPGNGVGAGNGDGGGNPGGPGAGAGAGGNGNGGGAGNGGGPGNGNGGGNGKGAGPGKG